MISLRREGNQRAEAPAARRSRLAPASARRHGRARLVAPRQGVDRRVATGGRVPHTPDQHGDVRRHPENERPEGVAVLRARRAAAAAYARPIQSAGRFTMTQGQTATRVTEHEVEEAG
jgi:hypothetical protein